jgi:hypothetical protein
MQHVNDPTPTPRRPPALPSGAAPAGCRDSSDARDLGRIPRPALWPPMGSKQIVRRILSNRFARGMNHETSCLEHTVQQLWRNSLAQDCCLVSPPTIRARAGFSTAWRMDLRPLSNATMQALPILISSILGCPVLRAMSRTTSSCLGVSTCFGSRTYIFRPNFGPVLSQLCSATP